MKNNSILKIKDWLNKKPDHEKFQETVEEWDKQGIPYGFKDMLKLAIKCNLPTPVAVKSGELIWN